MQERFVPEWSEIYHLASVHLSTGIFLSSDKWAGPRNNVGWCRSGSKKWSYKDNRSSIRKNSWLSVQND